MRCSAEEPRQDFSPDLAFAKMETGVSATKNRPGGNEAPGRAQSQVLASARAAILPPASLRATRPGTVAAFAA